MSTKTAWRPLDEAPRDGTPIRIKGYNWGAKSEGAHYRFAWWKDGPHFETIEMHATMLSYAVSWRPLTELEKIMVAKRVKGLEE